MARFLQSLARWSFRRRWVVVALWLVAFVGAGVGASTLSGPTDDSFSMPGIESARAFDLIKERSPGAAPDGAQARVAIQVPEGESLLDDGVRAEVTAALDTLATESHLATVTPWDTGTISEDGRTGVATVAYGVVTTELADGDREALAELPGLADDAGFTIAVGGDAVQAEMEGLWTELIGVAIALVVLVITFGSLLAAGMPLLTAILGVGIGVSLITAATGFVDLSSATPMLATMLGLAVGIDYALFVVSRYRHELVAGHDPEVAAGRAVGTAGSAVVVAGLTVIIALAGLSVVGITFLTQMGLAAAGTVAVAVLVAISLLPALFGFARGRLTRRLRVLSRTPLDAEGDTAGVVPAGRRWVDLVLRHRVVALLAGVVVTGALAVPMLSMTLALPDEGAQSPGSGPRVAYDLIAENFGPGVNGPLMVIVDVQDSSDPVAAVAAVNAAVQQVDDDVAAVIPAGPADPSPEAAAAFEQQLAMTGLATLQVVPTSGPSDEATQDLVHAIRAAVDEAEAATGAEVLVTGLTALGVDISEELADAFPRYLAVIVGLAFLLLVLVFRSVLIPVKAIAGFLASIVVALGATVAVFQWGWAGSLIGIDEGAPIMSMLPILMTGILFGLAMDYEFFLVTRMQEEHAHGAPNDRAIAVGFQHGARVVTAAALIMFSIFAAFAFIDDPIIKSVGFALALGILADAFLVRMTLVPAFMSLVGERIWWLPGWAQKVLPDLDIEGAKLAKRPS